MFPNGSQPRPGTRPPATAYLPAPPSVSGTTPTLVTRWGITVLASVWMFALGIVVGRQTVPLDVPPDPTPSELTRMADQERQEADDKMNGIVTSLETENAGFHEDMNKPAQQSSALSPGPKPDLKSDQKTPEVKRPLTSKTTTPVAPVTPPPVTAPVPANPPGRPPATIPEAEETSPPATGGGSFFGIQVASFATGGDADAVVAHLREKGFAGAYRIDESVPGAGMRYRVKIGYFGSRSAAQHTLGKLRQEENLNDAYVFQRQD